MATQRKGKCGCNCLKKISNFITGAMENFFYRLGKLVGKSPWITILISLVLTGACSSGLIKFTEESRGEKLWVPQDSIAIEHQNWVDEHFPSKSRAALFLSTGNNVLTPEVLKQHLEIDKQVKAINNGTKDNWEKICYRLGPTCFTKSILELWSFNETIINSLTQDDIINKVNQAQLKSPLTGRKVVISGLLGAITKNSSGAIISAEALSTTYLIKNQDEVIGGSRVDKVGEAWENAFGSVLKRTKQSSVQVLYYTRSSQQTAVSNSIQSDVTLLSAGYMLIIVYVAVMLGRFTRLRLKAWLALFGVICVGLAIGVSFGLSSAFGEFYGPVHSVLPFLLLGIGVDDMFVIVQAWNNLSPEIHKMNDIPERVGLALKHAGVSITITSLTDFLAFVIGATTVLPALRSFCLFAGIGILADFVLQATFFTAWMTIDARRQDKGRDSCCCCIKLSDSYSESECGRKDNLQVFFGKYIAPVFLSFPGKIIIVIITGALFGVNMYGTLRLEQNFDRAWFLPSDSMAYKYTIATNKYFPVEGASTAVYTGKIDYFAEQGNLRKIHEVALSDKYIVQSSINSWYDGYIEWAKKDKPSSVNGSQITNKTLFYNLLKEYLMTAGGSYAGDVVYAVNSTNNTLILAARMDMKHKDVASTQIEVKAMEQFRKGITDLPIKGEHFAYSRFYIGWETNKIIKEELYRNMGLALAAVFVVTLVVLANLWTCLMVLSCIAFTLVCIMGTCHFWGLYIGTVSTICLVLAVGLTVDYASHVAHTFMVTPGTNEERAFMTLYNIGPAVWNGGFSTFLAFVLLASSDSYVFTVFFKIFFTVVVFGLFHGLCFLPVLLSSIGPAPYDSALQTSDDHKKPGVRSSPVHPAGKRGSCEMAGKPGTKPSKEFSLESLGSINDGFHIPTPDYHDVDMSRIVKNAQLNPGSA